MRAQARTIRRDLRRTFAATQSGTIAESVRAQQQRADAEYHHQGRHRVQAPQNDQFAFHAVPLCNGPPGRPRLGERSIGYAMRGDYRESTARRVNHVTYSA